MKRYIGICGGPAFQRARIRPIGPDRTARRRDRRDGAAHLERARREAEGRLHQRHHRQRRHRGARPAEHPRRPHDHVEAHRDRCRQDHRQHAGRAGDADRRRRHRRQRRLEHPRRHHRVARDLQGPEARRDRKPGVERLQEHLRDGRSRRRPADDERSLRRDEHEVRLARRARLLRAGLLSEVSGRGAVVLLREEAARSAGTAP